MYWIQSRKRKKICLYSRRQHYPNADDCSAPKFSISRLVQSLLGRPANNKQVQKAIHLENNQTLRVEGKPHFYWASDDNMNIKGQGNGHDITITWSKTNGHRKHLTWKTIKHWILNDNMNIMGKGNGYNFTIKLSITCRQTNTESISPTPRIWHNRILYTPGVTHYEEKCFDQLKLSSYICESGLA